MKNEPIQPEAIPDTTEVKKITIDKVKFLAILVSVLLVGCLLGYLLASLNEKSVSSSDQNNTPTLNGPSNEELAESENTNDADMEIVDPVSIEIKDSKIVTETETNDNGTFTTTTFIVRVTLTNNSEDAIEINPMASLKDKDGNVAYTAQSLVIPEKYSSYATALYSQVLKPGESATGAVSFILANGSHSEDRSPYRLTFQDYEGIYETTPVDETGS